jgi:hypothetical protein
MLEYWRKSAPGKHHDPMKDMLIDARMSQTDHSAVSNTHLLAVHLAGLAARHPEALRQQIFALEA